MGGYAFLCNFLSRKINEAPVKFKKKKKKKKKKKIKKQKKQTKKQQKKNNDKKTNKQTNNSFCDTVPLYCITLQTAQFLVNDLWRQWYYNLAAAIFFGSLSQPLDVLRSRSEILPYYIILTNNAEV